MKSEGKMNQEWKDGGRKEGCIEEGRRRSEGKNGIKRGRRYGLVVGEGGKIETAHVPNRNATCFITR